MLLQKILSYPGVLKPHSYNAIYRPYCFASPFKNLIYLESILHALYVIQQRFNLIFCPHTNFLRFLCWKESFSLLVLMALSHRMSLYKSHFCCFFSLVLRTIHPHLSTASKFFRIPGDEIKMSALLENVFYSHYLKKIFLLPDYGVPSL